MNTLKKLLVITKKGKPIKKIKVDMNDDRAEIRISVKRNGEKTVIKKQYKGTKDKIVAFMCVEAVIKYWPKFDPQIHDMYWTQDCGKDS